MRKISCTSRRMSVGKRVHRSQQLLETQADESSYLPVEANQEGRMQQNHDNPWGRGEERKSEGVRLLSKSEEAA
jgi:hypothetical protein